MVTLLPAEDDIPDSFRDCIDNSMRIIDSTVKTSKRSHCWKRRGASELHRHEEFQRIPGRCGWEKVVKFVHSIFDYIDIYDSDSDKRCGLALSGWTVMTDGVRLGGIPPAKKDIESNLDLFSPFVDALFGQ